MSSAVSSRSSILVAHHGPWLLLALGCLVVPLVISPVYEVPQNDEWAYFQVIELWFETGEIRHLGWNDPTLLFQIVWGGFFAWILGLSYTALRLSTLVLAVVGVFSLYGILRRTGATRGRSALGAAMLLLNPWFLILGYSFNTDVSYISLALAATLVFLIAIERENLALYLAGGLLSACAFLVRQPGLLIPVVFSGYVLVTSRPDLRRRFVKVVASLAPVLVAYTLYSDWIRGQTGVSWLESASNLHPFFRTPTLAGLDNLFSEACLNAAAGAMTLGALLIPLLFVVVTVRERESGSRWISVGLLAGVCVLAAASWFLDARQFGMVHGWPYQGNYFTRGGVLTQYQVLMVGPPWAWNVLTLLVPLLGAGLLAASGSALRRAWRSLPDGTPGLVLTVFIVQFLPSFGQIEFYDRYLLVLVPGVAVALTGRAPLPRKVGLAVVAMTLCFGAISLEYTRAYVDRAQAGWALAEKLVQRGTRPEEILLGFEWSGSHLYLDAVRTLDPGYQFDLKHRYPWDSLTDYRYFVAEFDVRPAGPHETYRGFLSKRRHYIGALRGPS